MESEKRSLYEELERVRLKSQRAGVEVDKLQKKVDDLQHFSELERQVGSPLLLFLIILVHWHPVADCLIALLP